MKKLLIKHNDYKTCFTKSVEHKFRANIKASFRQLQ